MTEVKKAITDLLTPDGKASPQMTHALKFIGDGSMQNGLQRLANYFVQVGERNGAKKAGIRGGLAGFTLASVLFTLGILIKKKIETDKKLEDEGQAILQCLEESKHSDEATLSK